MTMTESGIYVPTLQPWQTLSLLVHGESKVGKTWLGDSTPAPRLILDAEGGIQWTNSVKCWWDPAFEPPPILGQGRPAPGADVAYLDWQTCVVTVRDWSTVQQAYQWLNFGQHVFTSVTLDSISEVQKRAKDNLVGPMGEMRTQDWGALLSQMEMLVRQFRDLTMHPTRPLQCVCVIAFTREQSGKFRPYVQGQLSITMPYFLDIIGYLFAQRMEDGSVVRRLLVGPDAQFEAGERVGGRLGNVVDPDPAHVMQGWNGPSIEHMMHRVYGLVA